MDKLKRLISTIDFNEPYKSNVKGHQKIFSSVYLLLPLTFAIDPPALRPHQRAFRRVTRRVSRSSTLARLLRRAQHSVTVLHRRTDIRLTQPPHLCRDFPPIRCAQVR